MRYRDDFFTPEQFPQPNPEKKTTGAKKPRKGPRELGVDPKISLILAGVIAATAVLGGLIGQAQGPSPKAPDVKNEKKAK